eukprot:110655-Heterocapsa_arctica.AAC.1
MTQALLRPSRSSASPRLLRPASSTTGSFAVSIQGPKAASQCDPWQSSQSGYSQAVMPVRP